MQLESVAIWSKLFAPSETCSPNRGYLIVIMPNGHGNALGTYPGAQDSQMFDGDDEVPTTWQEASSATRPSPPPELLLNVPEHVSINMFKKAFDYNGLSNSMPEVDI